MKTTLLSIVILIFLSIFSYSKASASMDHQVWQGIGLSKKIYPNLEMAFDKEIRFETGIRFKNFDKMTFAVNYDAAGWLQLDVEYWRGQSRSGNEWRKEQKPVLAVNFKYNIPRVELSARHKLEYRIIEKYENFPVYKFRTQVKYPFKNHKLLSEAYINDEIYVKLNTNTFYMNRIRAGVKLKYGYVSPDINYVFQLSEKSEGWIAVHAFAVKIWMQF